MKSSSTVAEDLRKVLGDARFSDMLFICSDGQEVPALRMLLAARSPVLQSMLLTSAMVESKLKRVPLPGTRGSIMRVCIEYLYTDNVQSSSWPKPLDEAVEVAAAARFFLIPGLENLCIEYLTSAIAAGTHINSSSSISAHEMIRAYNVCGKLYHDQAHEKLGMLLSAFTESIHLSLIRSFDGYTHLSERGCLTLLENWEPSDALALKVYYLLLHAIRWCASRVLEAHPDQDEFLEILDEFFPLSEAHLVTMLETGCRQPADVHKLQMIKRLSDPLASFLNKASLDLSRVSPTILCSIFEPLQIIPSSRLLAAYRIHALCRPDLQWDNLHLHENYKVSRSDPTEISCVGGMAQYGSGVYSRGQSNFEGFARSNMCVTPANYMILEWEIVILEACDSIRFGFCFDTQIPTSETKCLLGERSWSIALGSDGILYDDKRATPIRSKPVGRRVSTDGICVSKGTRLGVRINFHEATCSFIVNGVSKLHVSILFEKGGVYPALSMDKPGKARLQLVLQEAVLKQGILTKAPLEEGPPDCK